MVRLRGAELGVVFAISSRLFRAAVAADSVNGFVPRGADEPRARVRGRALRGPLLQSDSVSFLQHLLGEIEVAEETNERGEDSALIVRGEALPDPC